ncbi:hypothetical protein AB3S75_040125 [Citrus x aurantiifolia]
MTTGRINQVTFLPDAGARMTVPLGAPFGASVGPPRRARQSFASRDNACSLDGSRPRPRVHAQHSTSESTGRDSVGQGSQASEREARREHGARLASTPHPEGHKADGENRNQQFRFVGRQHRIPNEPSRQQLRLGKD